MMVKFFSRFKTWIAIVVAGTIGAVVQDYIVWHPDQVKVSVGSTIVGIVVALAVIGLVAWALLRLHWLAILLLLPVGVVVGIFHDSIFSSFSWELVLAVVVLFVVSLVLTALARPRHRGPAPAATPLRPRGRIRQRLARIPRPTVSVTRPGRTRPNPDPDRYDEPTRTRAVS